MTTATTAEARLGWRTHSVLALLVVAYASSFIGRQIMSVMIEPIKLEFGVSDTAMGLVSGLSFAAVYALLGLPAGRLADRHSRMRVLAITAALWALATLLCGMATGFLMLALVRMLVAATEAPVTPTSLSLIADLYPVRNRSLAISCFTGAPTLSAIVGLSMGAWLVDVHGWRTGFVLIAIPLLFLSLVFGFLVREPQRGRWDGVADQPDPGETLRQAAMTLLRNRPYLILMSASALTTFSAYAFAMWNTSFLVRSHALSLQHAGILAGVVSGASMAFGGVFSGWLTDRLSSVNRAWLLRIPLLGHLLGLAGMVLYLLWPQATWLTVAGLPVPTAMLWATFSGFFQHLVGGGVLQSADPVGQPLAARDGDRPADGFLHTAWHRSRPACGRPAERRTRRRVRQRLAALRHPVHQRFPAGAYGLAADAVPFRCLSRAAPVLRPSAGAPLVACSD